MIDPTMIIGSLVVVISILLSLMFIILTKTPALDFLRASMSKGMIIINPAENKYISFEPAARKGSLSYVKGKGFYIINPKDVFMEKRTKVPCAIAYGNFALSLDMRISKLTEKMQEMGINNYMDIITVYKDQCKQKKEAFASGGKKAFEGLTLMLLGVSVPFDSIVDYFGRNERADYIEAEIQRRTAANQNILGGGGGEMIKYLIYIGIFLILVSIAYKFWISATSGTVDLNQLQNIMKNTPINTGATGLG